MVVYAISIVATLSLLVLIFFLLSGLKGSQSEDDAKKFARLLVAEIKLYNDYKMQRGLRNNNLYESLRDEIEEAAKTYRKRVPNPEYFQYFNDALVNVLADGDKDKLGREFNKTLE
jgi:ABC-type transport system involved in cytochrome bd biosynthesis fused ATPase/permease subunit